jgi:hypothetical protein
MKYYKLKDSIDSKIVGKYPQSEECKNFGDIYTYDYNHILETLIDIPEPILLNKAKETTSFSDSIISLIFFLMIKDDFVNFLKNCKIGNYKIWDMNVHHKGKVIRDYKLFHLIDAHQKSYVDYKNSDFYLGTFKDYNFIGDTIKITDHENFLSTTEVLKSQKLILKCRKHVFNFKDATEDLIRIDNTTMVGTKGYFVSEKLKNDIEEKGFTGMAFKEIEEIDNRKRIEVIY